MLARIAKGSPFDTTTARNSTPVASEANLAARRKQRFGPVGDKFVLRIDEMALPIVGETPVVDDEGLAIDAEFGDAVPASAIDDGIRKTERLECGDHPRLDQPGLGQSA